MAYRKVINNELTLLKIVNYERIIFYALNSNKSLLEEVVKSITMIENEHIPFSNLVAKDYEVFAPRFDRVYSEYEALQRNNPISIAKVKEINEKTKELEQEMNSLLANASISKAFVKKLIDKMTIRKQEELPLIAIRCNEKIRRLKDKLIEDNRYLIVNIAQKLGEKERLEDTVNYGIQGLVKAINLFEPLRKLKFSTYAYYWIQVFVREAMFNETGNIKIPIYLQKKARRAERFYNKFLVAERREPTREELSAISGIRESELKEIERVKKMSVASIHKPIGEKTTLEDVLADERGEDSAVEFIHNGLAKLDKLEANILTDLYGLGGNPVLSNSEICNKYEVSSKELGKLRNKALDSLKKALA